MREGWFFKKQIIALLCPGYAEHWTGEHLCSFSLKTLVPKLMMAASVLPPTVHVHAYEKQCVLLQTHKKKDYFNQHYQVFAEGVHTDTWSWLGEIC